MSNNLSVEVADLCHVGIILKVLQRGSKAWTHLIKITFFHYSFNNHDIKTLLLTHSCLFTVYVDDLLDRCGLCWVCWPVKPVASQPVSPVLVGLPHGAQSCLPWKGSGNLAGSVPGHYGMGDRSHSSEAEEEILVSLTKSIAVLG